MTGRYACYDTYACRDGRWVAVGAIEPQFYANLCRRLGCEQWLAHQTDDAAQEKIRADFAAAFRTRDRDDWVAELAPPTPASRPCTRSTSWSRTAVPRARHVRRGAAPERGALPPGGAAARGDAASGRAGPVPDGARTDTDALLAAAGIAREEIARMRSAGVVA